MGINFLAILRDKGDIRELRVLAQFAECRSDFSLKLIQFQKHFLLHFFFGADFLLSAIFSKEYCTAITRSSTQSSSRSSSLRTNRCATIPGFATSSFWHHWLPQFFCSQCQGIVRGQNLNWTRTDIKKNTKTNRLNLDFASNAVMFCFLHVAHCMVAHLISNLY